MKINDFFGLVRYIDNEILSLTLRGKPKPRAVPRRDRPRRERRAGKVAKGPGAEKPFSRAHPERNRVERPGARIHREPAVDNEALAGRIEPCMRPGPGGRVLFDRLPIDAGKGGLGNPAPGQGLPASRQPVGAGAQDQGRHWDRSTPARAPTVGWIIVP